MRITCQFRDEGTMVYELKAGMRFINVRIRAPETTADGWQVVLAIKGDGEHVPTSGIGATRLLAMAAVERDSGTALNPRDWAGLRDALTTVRAL